MVQWIAHDMGGEIPRRDDRLLPPSMAAEAVNVDLHAGRIEGFSQPEFVIDLSTKAPWPVRKAYRCPAPPPGGPDVWLPLPSEFSQVVRSPLANDTQHRYYWTNPPGSPDEGAWWSTYADIAAGNPPFNMGFIAPDPGIVLTVTATGGTPPDTQPYVTRSYTFTYIAADGSESSPALPSAPVDGASDGTWTVSGLPTTAPSNPTGMHFSPVQNMRLYRTVTGTSSGANFYFVADIPFGSASYVDTTQDLQIVNNNTLESTSWMPPPPHLDGLIGFPGGMLIGFTDNTIHFAEPDRPHAWPAAYDTSVAYPIQGLAIWQQTLVVLTKGYPSNGSGTTPGTFFFSQINVPEPCIARGSIVTDLAGVYYASQNGLVMLNYFGMQNQTLSNMTKNLWLTEYQAAQIIACRHRSQYLAINGTDQGFIIDYTEQRMGVMHITPVINVVSVWNDPFTGDSYMCADGVVWLWDSPNTPPLIYRWRSKEFYQPLPISLGACQISLDAAVAAPRPPPPQGNPGPPPPPPASAGLDLPAGCNAIFNLFVGPAGKNRVQILSKRLVNPREVFRLPSGRKAFDWQCEIIATVPVHSIELATTMKELRKV